MYFEVNATATAVKVHKCSEVHDIKVLAVKVHTYSEVRAHVTAVKAQRFLRLYSKYQ